MKIKKLFALLLSAVMVLGMLPVGALAATSLPEAGNDGPKCPQCGSEAYEPYGDEGIMEGEPTCTEGAYWAYGWCNNCGEIIKPIPPLGHDWHDGQVTKQPTCTQPGEKTRICARCGLQETTSVPPLGHDWDDPYQVKAPTCLEKGQNDHECARCHVDEYDSDIPALGHNFAPWEVVRPATPTQKGLEKSSCRRCDETRYREFDYVGPNVDDVSVGKKVISTPANGEYYVEGEEIQYWIWISYEKNTPCLEDIHMTDPVVGYNDDVLYADVCATFGQAFNRTVTREDVERGYVENTAEFSWNFIGETQRHSATTNTVTVPTGRAAKVDDEQWYLTATQGYSFTGGIDKYEVSSPSNGEYYVEGETITYFVVATIVDSYGLKNIWVFDSLISGSPLLSFDPDEPTTLTAQYDYIVTAQDVERGYVENFAWIQTETEDDRAMNSAYSNVVTVPTGVGEAVGKPTLKKEVYEFSNPANGSYYVEGETVLFDVTITNPANGKEITDIVIWDSMSNSEAVLYQTDYIPSLKPGEKYITQFSVLVTEFDVAQGSIDNTAGADYYIDGEIYSTNNAYASVPTGGDGKDYDLFIGKTCCSVPANGQYFCVGDEVIFALEVQNIGTKPLKNVKAFDAGYVFSVASVLNPGESRTVLYHHIVTENNAILGYYNNEASAAGFDDNGVPYGASSNIVTIYAGYNPFGVISEMEITKAEISSPANGIHYTEGETIEYEITVENTGETEFTDCVVYDILVGTAKKEIGSIEIFRPGEARRYNIKYRVTAADVAAGFVANSAIVSGDMGEGYVYTATSNTVISDTDGIPDVLPPDGTPWTPGSKTGTGSITGEITLKGEKKDGRQCISNLMKYNDGSWEYLIDFCTLHDNTRKDIEKMLAGAKDDAAMLKQLEKAKKLWTDHIEDMYKALYDHADTLAKLTILDEQVSFFDLVANKELMLTALYPEEPVVVAQNIVDMLEERCNKMCYDIHNAPNLRADRMTDLVEIIDLPHLEKCFGEFKLEEDRTVKAKLSLCMDHNKFLEQLRPLFNTEEPAQAWIDAYGLLVVELHNSTSKLSSSIAREQALAVGAYYRSLMLQIQCHEGLLNLLYKDDLATTGETMCSIIRDYIMELCVLTPDEPAVKVSKGFNRPAVGRKKGS